MRAVRRNFDIARLICTVGVYFIALNDLGRRALDVLVGRGYLPERDGSIGFMAGDMGAAKGITDDLSAEGAFVRDMTASELDDIGKLPSCLEIVDGQVMFRAEPARDLIPLPAAVDVYRTALPDGGASCP